MTILTVYFIDYVFASIVENDENRCLSDGISRLLPTIPSTLYAFENFTNTIRFFIKLWDYDMVDTNYQLEIGYMI